jgi:FtsP/CotA-like multicopper oxidase with cupredoxin domain
MDLGRIDQTVTAATTERWEVTNRSGNPHNFHIHGVQFKVAAYEGGTPPPTLAGWKDTTFIPPASTVRLLVQLPDYADPAVPYMFHCHLLQHEDNGMMGQFVVVQPGQPPTRPSQEHRHDPRQGHAGAGAPPR